MRLALGRLSRKTIAFGSGIIVFAALAYGVNATAAAPAASISIQAGESVIAAKFRDQCNGTSDVQLLNPYSVDLVFEVNGERVVVAAQQRPWRTVDASRRGRVIDIQIFNRKPATGKDNVTHLWSSPRSCAGANGPKMQGNARLAASNDGQADVDTAVAARFRDRCDGKSDVQLPNPYTVDLKFDVNGKKIVVASLQQPWYTTATVQRRRIPSIEIFIGKTAGATDSITHAWSSPGTCASPTPRKS